jgi:hypothetical protein
VKVLCLAISNPRSRVTRHSGLQRILFYTTRDDHKLAQIDAVTSQLEAALWSAVQVPAAAQPTLPLKTISSLNHPHVCVLHGS